MPWLTHPGGPGQAPLQQFACPGPEVGPSISRQSRSACRAISKTCPVRQPLTSYVPDRWWTMSRLSKGLVLVTVGAAAIFSGVGIWSFFTASTVHDLTRPIPGGATSEGRVVSYDRVGSRLVVYRPWIQFVAKNGSSITFAGAETLSKPSVGAGASVSYDISNPRHAHDTSESGAWAGFVTEGLVLLAASGSAGYGVGRMLRRP